MEQEKKYSKKLFMVIGISVVLMISILLFLIIWFNPIKESSRIQQIPVVSEEELSELENAFGAELKQSEEAEAVEVERTVEELEPVVTEPVAQTLDSISVKDITVFSEDKAAIFRCYEKDAVSYKWEFYSSLDKKWSDISLRTNLETYMEYDGLNRYVSCLSVPVENNDTLNVRCTVKLEAEKDEIVTDGILTVFSSQVKEISISELEAESGKYLSNLDVIVTIIKEDGKESEVKGIQNLAFCIPQEEKESTEYNEENNLTTEIFTKTYKESPYYLVQGENQEIPVKIRCGKENHEINVNVTGIDTTPPELTEVYAAYEVSGQDVKSTPVKITAAITDNYSVPSEIQFAFGKADLKTDKLEWKEKLPLEVEVRNNGQYILYAKDESENIGRAELEIIAVDMKPPIINEIRIAEGTEKSIVVDATDKTVLEYGFCIQGDTGNVTWQKESTYSVSTNGEYRILVKDAAGNTAEGQITVTGIDTTSPVIVGIYTADEKAVMQQKLEKMSIEIVSDAADPVTSMNMEPNPADSAEVYYPIASDDSSSMLIHSNPFGDIKAGMITASQGEKGEKGDAGATGASGTNGATGAKGADGTSYYMHVRYAVNENGENMTATPSTETRYIGIYTGVAKDAPNTADSYQWSLYKGEASHIYIKYATNDKGENMCDEPTADSSYVGMCTTSAVTAPTDNTVYKWCKINYGSEVTELKQIIESLSVQLETVKNELAEMKQDHPTDMERQEGIDTNTDTSVSEETE